LNADGKADLVVTGLYSSGALAFGFNGVTLASGGAPARVFNDLALSGGTAPFPTIGDLNADGFGDLVLGAGAWGNGHVIAYSGRALVQTNTRTALLDFIPLGVNTVQGVAVAVRDLNSDGIPDVLSSSGELVTAYLGGVLPPIGARPTVLRSFDPDPATVGGYWVG
jgi:hypothetical protein